MVEYEPDTDLHDTELIFLRQDTTHSGHRVVEEGVVRLLVRTLRR